jgi:hypothetical protein
MKTYVLCTLMTALIVHQAVNAQPKQIQLSVCNKTDQILVIAARYEVLPSPNKHLASMPNPFVFVEAPANETTYAHFNRVGGGRLGKIEEIVIRTRNEDGPYTFKTLSAAELNTTNGEDMLMVTIDTSMLPAKK